MSHDTSEPIGAKAAEGIDFDPDSLRDKYRAERDKRIRPEGIDQFIEVKDAFGRYAADPLAQDPSRSPLTDQVEVLVVGGGWGGLLAAARLRDSGFADIRIIDSAGDFGGTWYWNRYPGAQCDVESYIYLPLLEETGYIPTEKYSHQPEILAHARRIGEKYDLYSNAYFYTHVTELRWLEEEARWLVVTNRQDRFRARFVIMATGPLNRPKLPGIPGLGAFAGRAFHTSRWDYSYTGGNTTGNLRKLADKSVAVIGTGASGVQVVPYLAKSVGHLYVCQRTPTVVDERRNRPTDPEWVKTLTPGWQQRRMQNFHVIVSGGREEEDLVSDAWTDICRNLNNLMPAGPRDGITLDEMGRLMEQADFLKMNQVRARIDSIVHHPKTAAALKPWYRMFCKRPTFNDEYLQVFNRANVTLLDTGGRGVDRITANGLAVGGVEYAVDCIVFATGFEVGTRYTRRADLEVYGTGAKTLTDCWELGVKSLHGFCSHQFPNLFNIGIGQGGFTPNFPHTLAEQASHITAILARARHLHARRIEPTVEAEAEWVATIREKGGANLEFLMDCTPSYFNNEGKPREAIGVVTTEVYGGGFDEFYALMRAWRTTEQMRGLRFE